MILFWSLPVMLLLTACVTLFGEGQLDSKDVLISTLDLFDQGKSTNSSSSSWQGDWIFRRDRLELIDRELAATKPDIFIVQAAMARGGSFADHDGNILRAGSLGGYSWQEVLLRRTEPIGEWEHLAVSTGFPLTVEKIAATFAGEDFQLAVFAVRGLGEPIIIFNCRWPNAREQLTDQAFTAFKKFVLQVAGEQHSCIERSVIAGYMPTDIRPDLVVRLMSELKLKDTAKGFCQASSQCYTATTENTLFKAVHPMQAPAHVDHILVHAQAAVVNAYRSFRQSTEAPKYEKMYGLERLYPSLRFGWNAQVKLPSCP